MKNTYYIYAIICPETNLPRYIGATIQQPEVRLKAHYSQWENKPKRAWLQEILKKGKVPRIEILQTIHASKKIAYKLEKQIILEHAKNGCSLFNDKRLLRKFKLISQ